MILGCSICRRFSEKIIQFDKRQNTPFLACLIGQPFNSCDVASLCLLCESSELHVFNEFVSDFRAHELPPW